MKTLKHFFTLNLIIVFFVPYSALAETKIVKEQKKKTSIYTVPSNLQWLRNFFGGDNAGHFYIPPKKGNARPSNIKKNSSLQLPRPTKKPELPGGVRKGLEQVKEKAQHPIGRCDKSGDTSRTTSYQTEEQKALAHKCFSNRDDRSFECVRFITEQAVAAFSTEASCAGRITTEKLLCIFKQEVTRYDNNPYGRNGYGLAQMTTEGVKTVKRGFSVFKLGYEYDSFWDMIERSEEKNNKCSLTRNNALDRDTSIVMAATHLCAQAKHSPRSSGQFLSCEYNRGYSECKRVGANTHYARSVERCETTEGWREVEEQMRIASIAKKLKTQKQPASYPGSFNNDSYSSSGGSQ